MALDRNDPIEEPNPPADDPTATGRDSTVKTEERPRRSVVVDARGRTGAEIRFQESKQVQGAEADSVKASLESNRDGPTGSDSRTDPEESEIRTGPTVDRRTNESGPRVHDDPQHQPSQPMASDRVDRSPHTVITDTKGRSGAEIRFQQSQDVRDDGNLAAVPDESDPVHHDGNLSEGSHSNDLESVGLSQPAEEPRLALSSGDRDDNSEPADVQGAPGEHSLQDRKQAESDESELGGIDSSRERANQDHVVDHLDATTDYDADASPTVNERYLVRDMARPIPLFDGPPLRDQSNQGTVGDCGIVATFGAIAAHRPDAIPKCIRQTGEGAFAVTLHDVDGASPSNPIARPNGDTTTYFLNDELPVRTDESTRPLAGIQADRSGWAAILEKAVAAQDQTWSQAERSDWQSEWLLALKNGIDADRNDEQLPPSPDASPTGYDRLNLGSTVMERTNLLAQITGEAAETRRLPDEQAGEQALLDDLRSKLSEGKPIVLGTRAQLDNEVAPYSPDVFSFDHVYEVVDVTAGRIHLRNPWGVDEFGRSSDPPPMDAHSFWELFRKYNPDGSRAGYYSTLE